MFRREDRQTKNLTKPNNTLPPSKKAAQKVLSTQRSLLDTICSFLSVATHHILYLRRIYPPVSFTTVRAYNYPVRQSRHPEVCEWINDSIAAIRDQLTQNTIDKVQLCIYECDDNETLERWTFDMPDLPPIIKRDHDVPFESLDDPELRRAMKVADLEASFRAVISRLDTVSGNMRPLPDGPGAPECSFTLTITIKDTAKAPVKRNGKFDRQWIVAEADPRDVLTASQAAELPPEAERGSTYPIRRLDAGDLHMELYVEESASKLTLPSTYRTTLERAADLSYGAGTEKFDPLNGYDDSDSDKDAGVYKKPQGGAFTDYRR